MQRASQGSATQAWPAKTGASTPNITEQPYSSFDATFFSGGAPRVVGGFAVGENDKEAVGGGALVEGGEGGLDEGGVVGAALREEVGAEVGEKLAENLVVGAERGLKEGGAGEDDEAQPFAGETLEAAEQTGSSIPAAGFKGQPLPVQAGGPPIMIGGGARKVLTLAGRVADIVSFNFDNRAGVVGPASVQSAAASVMEQRISWVREGAGDRFDSIELEVGAYFTVVTPDTASGVATAEKMGGMFGMSADDMAAHPNALIGTADEICDRLVERRERYGISFVTVSDRNLEAFAPIVARLANT